MAHESDLILSTDLSEFFRDQVGEASSKAGLNLPEATECYLVNMLCDFSKPDCVVKLQQEPLALIYKNAVDALTPGEQADSFKRLGDVALYMAGFFSDFIDRSLVDIDYYISMGGGAYSSLSSLIGTQRQGEMFGELYMDLAEKFAALVEVLNVISEATSMHNPREADLLKLYERWSRTGSERIERLLYERGLMPKGRLPKDFIQ